LGFETKGLVGQTIEFESIKEKLVNLGEVKGENEDFTDFSSLKELLKDVEIVMLGEQSHGEATTYETKIKLIKYLHEELGYDILAFESGFYDCHMAWESIEAGEDVRTSMAKSIHDIWSTTKDFIPLVDYLKERKEKENKLKLVGFDSQFIGNYPFMSDLSKYLKTIDTEIVISKEWKHLEANFKYIADFERKKLRKHQPGLDTLFINYLVEKISNGPSDAQSDFWIQSLKNVKVYLSDVAFKTTGRDKQMGKNLIWLKEKYPNSKKEFFGDKVYTIGFTAYEGSYGLDYRRKIKPAKEGTLEFLLSQSEYDNFLVPLNDDNFKNYKSRPLGNFYMKNDIGPVMDAVIFNRYMTPPKNDYHFYLEIYPDNKNIIKIVEKYFPEE